MMEPAYEGELASSAQTGCAAARRAHTQRLARTAPAGPVAEGNELPDPVLASPLSAIDPSTSNGGGWNAVVGQAAQSPRHVPASPRHPPHNRHTATVISDTLQRTSTNGGSDAGSSQVSRMMLQPVEPSSPAASAPLPKLLSPAALAPQSTAGGPQQQELLPSPLPAMLPGMSQRHSVEMVAQQVVAPPPSLLTCALDTGAHATPHSPCARYGAGPSSGSLAVASPARLTVTAAVASTATGGYSQCASPVADTAPARTGDGSFAVPETIRLTLLTHSGNGTSSSGAGGGSGGSGPNSSALPPAAVTRAVGSSSTLMTPRLPNNGGGGGWVSPATCGAFAGSSAALPPPAMPLNVSASNYSSTPLPLPLPTGGAAMVAPAAPPPPPLAAGRSRNSRASVDAAAGALELPDADGDAAAASAAASAAADAADATSSGFADPPPPPRISSPAAAAVAAAAARTAEGRSSNSGSACSGSSSARRMALRSETPPKQIWSQAQQRGPAKPAIKKSNLSNVGAAAAAAAAAAVPARGASGEVGAGARQDSQQQRTLSSGGAAASNHNDKASGATATHQEEDEHDQLLDVDEGAGGGQPWFDENMQRARNQARLAAMEFAEEVKYVSVQEASGGGGGKSGRGRGGGGSRDARGASGSELASGEGGSRRCESESGAASGHRTIRGGNRSRIFNSGAGSAAAGSVAGTDASGGSGGGDPGLVRRRTFGEVFDHEEEERDSSGGGGGAGKKGGRRKGAPKKSASALTAAWRAFTSLAAKAIGGGGGGRVGAWGGGDNEDMVYGDEEPLPVQRSRDSRALHRKRLGLDGTQTAPAAWLRQHQQQAGQQELQPQPPSGSSFLGKSPLQMNSNDPVNAAVVEAAMEFLVARSAASAVGTAATRKAAAAASPVKKMTAQAPAAAVAGVVGA